jgi:hypothetical protein
LSSAKISGVAGTGVEIVLSLGSVFTGSARELLVNAEILSFISLDTDTRYANSALHRTLLTDDWKTEVRAAIGVVPIDAPFFQLGKDLGCS